MKKFDENYIYLKDMYNEKQDVGIRNNNPT